MCHVAGADLGLALLCPYRICRLVQWYGSSAVPVAEAAGRGRGKGRAKSMAATENSFASSGGVSNSHLHCSPPEPEPEAGAIFKFCAHFQDMHMRLAAADRRHSNRSFVRSFVRLLLFVVCEPENQSN